MKYLIFISLFIYGCATPYQPHGFLGGYSEMKLGDDSYVVYFAGNGYTSSLTADQYTHRRAKELCIKDGFGGFRVLGSQERNSSTLDYNEYNESYEITNKPGAKLYIKCEGKKAKQEPLVVEDKEMDDYLEDYSNESVDPVDTSNDKYKVEFNNRRNRK